MVIECEKCGFSETKNYEDSENHSVGEFVHVSMIDPKPGDLIEIKRGTYSHWVLYSGNGFVIHVTGDTPNSPEVSKFISNSCVTEKAYKKEEKLQKVAGENRCRINNLYDVRKFQNLKKRTVKDILKSAHQNLDEKCHYSVSNANCEHYVTQWKYGCAFSTQPYETGITLGYGFGFAFYSAGCFGFEVGITTTAMATVGLGGLGLIVGALGATIWYGFRIKKG